MVKLARITPALCVPVAAASLVRAQEPVVSGEATVPTVTAPAPARVERSADALIALELKQARREPRDLADVLAHSQGFSLRRQGGVGSETEALLVGLPPAWLVDGVPLELLGFPLESLGVPLLLLERIDVYRGVLPVRLASTTLGGAVNLVRDARYDSHAEASYQLGSFHTHRAAASGRYRDAASSFFAGGSAYADITDNDYAIDVEVPDARGALSHVTVPRFHDAHHAYRVSVEGGVVDRPWAKRLRVEAFAARFDKELQHDASMRVPYGEARYGQTSFGATAHYDVELGSDVTLDVVASYARQIDDFVDRSEWVYDWYGARIVRRRAGGGEIGPLPIDSEQTRDGVFGRALASWRLAPEHSLRVSITPWWTTQRAAGVSSASSYVSLVSGIEYQWDLSGGVLTSVVFVKDYVYAASGPALERPNERRDVSANLHRLGGGRAARAADAVARPLCLV